MDNFYLIKEQIRAVRLHLPKGYSRELKSGWYLNNFPSRFWNGISAHIFFTLFMFNVIAAYRSSQGRALTERGIVSLRQKHFILI